MITLIFRQHDGSEATREVEPGTSLMDAAVDNAVPGILGDCGGAMTCGTCHVFVEDSGGVDLPGIESGEDEMLDGTATPRASNSRLACQIELTPAMGTLRVSVPESQW